MGMVLNPGNCKAEIEQRRSFCIDPQKCERPDCGCEFMLDERDVAEYGRIRIEGIWQDGRRVYVAACSGCGQPVELHSRSSDETHVRDSRVIMGGGVLRFGEHTKQETSAPVPTVAPIPEDSAAEDRMASEGGPSHNGDGNGHEYDLGGEGGA